MAEDLTGQLIMIANTLSDELRDRLDVELSDRDWTAVSTALSKAVTRAGRVMANAIESASGVKVSVLSDGMEEVDLWREEYGDCEAD